MSPSQSLVIACLGAASCLAGTDVVSGRIRARAGHTAMVLTTIVLAFLLGVPTLGLSLDDFPWAMTGVLLCVAIYVGAMMRATGRVEPRTRSPRPVGTEASAQEPEHASGHPETLVLQWDETPEKRPTTATDDVFAA